MNFEKVILNGGSRSYKKMFLWNDSKYDIHISESGEYDICFVLDDCDVDIKLDSEVEGVKVNLLCINTSKDDRKVKVNLDAELTKNNVEYHVNILSIAWNKADIDVQWGITIPVWVSAVWWFLMEKTLLLSKDNKVNLLPKLDVRSSDVRASHGANIYSIDESELFYLMSKWISLDVWKKLYVQWYVRDMMSRLVSLDEKWSEDVVSKVWEMIN